MSQCVAQGRVVSEELLGPLRDSTDAVTNPEELQRRLAEDGYLFVRNVVNEADIAAARAEVFGRLAEVGEIADPPAAGIGTGESFRRERTADLGAFWQSVSAGAALRRVSHGVEVRKLMDAVLGTPTQPHDYMFLRPGPVGRSTHLHYDFPFFARGSERIFTVWLALGDIPVEEGPLMVLEGSHRFDDLIEPVRKIDYESSDTPLVQMTDDTADFVRERNARLLTSDFRPGDLVIFGMFSMHGTLDNNSPAGRVRLSCDVRWQPATDPVDPRYLGDDPPGTTGAGYGELNGAKPLNEDWHKR